MAGLLDYNPPQVTATSGRRNRRSPYADVVNSNVSNLDALYADKRAEKRYQEEKAQAEENMRMQEEMNAIAEKEGKRGAMIQAGNTAANMAMNPGVQSGAKFLAGKVGGLFSSGAPALAENAAVSVAGNPGMSVAAQNAGRSAGGTWSQSAGPGAFTRGVGIAAIEAARKPVLNWIDKEVDGQAGRNTKRGANVAARMGQGYLAAGPYGPFGALAGLDTGVYENETGNEFGSSGFWKDAHKGSFLGFTPGMKASAEKYLGKDVGKVINAPGKLAEKGFKKLTSIF